MSNNKLNKVDLNQISGDVIVHNDNINIKRLNELLPPISVIERYRTTSEIESLVANSRIQVKDILHGRDDRLLVIVGPCSIHDTQAALEYANFLKPLIEKYKDQLCILMRVYFEKPRTTVGWKGLINDPYLDDSYMINDGIRIARALLRDINSLGVPVATEFLDVITPQYIADLISWGAIGARTTESQIHRELASGLSCPIGFKNATSGSIKVAIDAMLSASNPHAFISINKFGFTSIVETTGNSATHVILRGGDKGTNYDAQSVAEAVQKISEHNFYPGVMVDFSHANSSKDYRRQAIVAKDVAEQIAQGSTFISSVMIESNLVAGSQVLTNQDNLIYGQSITDGCVDLTTTEQILDTLAEAVKQRRLG